MYIYKLFLGFILYVWTLDIIAGLKALWKQWGRCTPGVGNVVTRLRMWSNPVFLARLLKILINYSTCVIVYKLPSNDAVLSSSSAVGNLLWMLLLSNLILKYINIFIQCWIFQETWNSVVFITAFYVNHIETLLFF